MGRETGEKMAIFVIGDTHLSLGGAKAMDVFPGWEGYVPRLEANWRERVSPGDTVVIPGDVSWGMSLEEALADFQFLHSLPGEKVLLKGNHDYWWATRAKMERFFADHGLTSLTILHNNALVREGMALCGTRGWILEPGDAQDEKVSLREEQRLRLSLEEGARTGLPLRVFLHYPPLLGGQAAENLLALLSRYRVPRCYYGHLHAGAARFAFRGECRGVQFSLASADFLHFCPLRVE